MLIKILFIIKELCKFLNIINDFWSCFGTCGILLHFVHLDKDLIKSAGFLDSNMLKALYSSKKDDRNFHKLKAFPSNRDKLCIRRLSRWLYISPKPIDRGHRQGQGLATRYCCNPSTQKHLFL